MILVALFVMIAGVALFAFGAWWLLRFAERLRLKQSAPVCGIVSILAVVLGMVGVACGIESDTGAGVVIALSALILGPLLGIIFGVMALFTKERPVALPIFGLLGSIYFVALYLFRL